MADRALPLPVPPALRRLAWLLPPAAGALAAGGFPPVALWPLTLFGLALLVALLARAPGPGRAALCGWLWGVGHFSLGNGWIATAFTYQSNMPAALGPVAVVLLALYLAVFPAAAAALAVAFARGRPTALVPAFAAAWILSEWLRGWLFTGFPWNPLAVAALGGPERAGLAQVLPWTGTYALSGLVALLAALWWRGWSLRVARPGLALLLVAVPLATFRLPQLTPPDPPGRLPFTLVQPGIPQDELDDPARFEAQFATAARLTRAARPAARRLVLWPESGLPDYLREGYPAWFYAATTYRGDPVAARARLGRVIGPGGLLLTGAVDLVVERGRAVAARNVVTVVDAGGTIRGSYAKAHLVPYGEYLPLRAWLTPLGLSRLVPGDFDFAAGPGPRTLALGPWGRAGVQICYEIVFSGEVIDRADRPDFLFNPSNDGWFGAAGPPQHLAQARLRAIEEGVPVLRATTNGISAVIDANGLIRHSLPRPIAGRIDGFVPVAHAPTPFARFGNRLALVWAAALVLCSMLALWRARG
ncbi:apolipoprotein N-acyltransferase [Novosphingobium piscinae]|uniref:Apolipoprotein N-acyltransferase n=1 Tax=Novosphingobium piscinae TaxID=1507448 RepID=A0A7X1KQT2_9SPHN|nr:apolipoprotein N-acyltransferase [Novosphingobium piscinae]MBC2669928.1 apolipoprotein N-acyltransferase [Novosphingobium piscinae]